MDSTAEGCAGFDETIVFLSYFIPVGTRVTPRPPDRSEHALLTHSAPTSGV